MYRKNLWQVRKQITWVKETLNTLSWFLLYITVTFILTSYAPNTFAAATVQSFAKTLKQTFLIIRELMTAAAYASGVGFSMIGLFKFKAYKDNPAQIPLSTPIALLAVGAGLLFLPTVFDISGDALFGSDARSGLPRNHINLL